MFILCLGRGDLAAAIVAMPTYAKSTIIAETNMRAFGLNDAAIAEQENALKADMKSPIVVASAKQITKLQAVEARKTELIAGGALGDQSALVQKMNVAGKMLNQSKSVFDQAVRKEQAGRNTLVLAQAAFHQNMADTKATDALVDAIASLQNASGERRNAEQAMKAGRQALDDAKRKLTDAQKQAMERVTAQAKQDVDAAVRKRAETRNKLTEQDRGDIGQQGIVPSVSALPEFVSNNEEPLAQGIGSGIMGEGAQGENTGEAGDAGKADGQTTEGPENKIIPKDLTFNIIKTPKYSRPDPSTYLNGEYIAGHKTKFVNGVTKISNQAPAGYAGPPGGTFVMPSSLADDLIAQAGGDFSKLEQLLGLEAGSLGTNPVRIDIEYPIGLRMPSGNEKGANLKWIPGGYTSGGIPEMVIDSPAPGQYTTRPIQ